MPPGAKQLLLTFHNATYCTDFDETSTKEQISRACSVAAGMLAKKMQSLRRLRLPMFYDAHAWVLPSGMLTHLLITMPYWWVLICIGCCAAGQSVSTVCAGC